MRIQPNREASGTAPLASQRTKSPQAPTIGQDKLALNNSHQLESALRRSPDLRADKIAQAKSLVQDPAYPSADVIREVSKRLADSLHEAAPSSGAEPKGG